MIGPNILNAASNLLGISFVIITGLHLTGTSRVSHADEIAWAAAVSLTISCLLAYLALRNTKGRGRRFEDWADRAFLLGLILLLAAVLWLAVSEVPIR